MKRLGIALVLGGFLGFLSSGLWSQDAEEIVDNTLERFHSKTIWAFFEMSIALDGAGKPRAARRIREERELFAVPDFYGPLIEITQAGNSTIFWHQDREGQIRNVILRDATTQLVTVERREVKKLRFEVAK